MVGILARKILIQSAPKKHIDNLKSTANTKDRFMLLYCFFQKGHLKSISLSIDFSQFRYGLLSIICRGHILSTNHKEDIDFTKGNSHFLRVLAIGDYHWHIPSP